MDLRAIHLHGVGVRYDGTAAPVLRDVDLTVEEGELVLVVGRTGSGKSTLLGALNGLVPHFTGGELTGTVRVHGRDTRDHRPRDLAYLVATSLEPDVRREVERGIVEAYHARLVDLGVDGYDLETCWEDYRFAQLQAPLVAVFGCAYGTRTERGDRMFAAIVRRSAAAIRDLGTLALVAG